MTDKEFKRLSRAQLIEIIYQFQLQVDALTEEIAELKRELADKRLRLSNAGNIAEAALEMNNCLRNAQNAAEQYLNEIQWMREETQAEQERILAQAREEVELILASAKKAHGDCDTAIETILQKYQQNPSDNG